MQLTTAALVLLCTTAFAQSDTSLGDLLSQNSDTLSTLTDALNTADLTDAVVGLSPATIFAPTNDAFSAFLDSPLGRMASDNSDLFKAVLQYHVYNAGPVMAADIPEQGAAYSSILDGGPYNDSEDGVHPVIIGMSDGSNVSLYSADGQPSHVIQADVSYNNGVVHVIDKVLIPPFNLSRTALDLGFSQFATAAQTNDAIGSLQSVSNYTFFVPTNDAFAAIAGGSGGLASLSDDQIVDVIQYHGCAPTIYSFSEAFANGSTCTTPSGDSLTITVLDDGAAFVNNARIIHTNVLVENGVVHVIDEVLNPSADFTGVEADAMEGTVAFDDVQATTITQSVSATATLPTSTFEVSTGGAAQAMETGAVGVAALFAAGAAYAAWV